MDIGEHGSKSKTERGEKKDALNRMLTVVYLNHQGESLIDLQQRYDKA